MEDWYYVNHTFEPIYLFICTTSVEYTEDLILCHSQTYLPVIRPIRSISKHHTYYIYFRLRTQLSVGNPSAPATNQPDEIMFRNQYDTDVTVWSPEGRLLQVEYAMESVKQGSATVGLRSKTHAVLGALKRSVSELSAHQKKILDIDSHLGIGIAGLTADARSLAKWMRTECLNHRYVYGTPIPSGRLLADLADRHQRTTQTYVRRPYGVGLLVVSCDKGGPHLHQTCPSGNLYEAHAAAIGARSQSGRTYLEKIHEGGDGVDLAGANRDDLIMHALRALAGCVGGDGELTKENGSVGVVGIGEDFTLIEGDELQPYLDRLELEGGEGGGGDADREDGDDAGGDDGPDPEAMAVEAETE